MAIFAKVSKVSREELAQASASLFGVPQKTSAPAKPVEKRTDHSYIKKLSNDEIKNFFKGYGYLSHQKYKDDSDVDFAHIVCENFEIILNDFDLAVICKPEAASASSNFDFPAFVSYCNSVDVAPEQAIADIVVSDLMTPRFPSYAERRRKHKDAQARDAFANLPKSMRILLKPLNEKVMAENSMMENKGKYGTFNAEDFLRTTYGEEQ